MLQLAMASEQPASRALAILDVDFMVVPPCWLLRTVLNRCGARVGGSAPTLAGDSGGWRDADAGSASAHAPSAVRPAVDCVAGPPAAAGGEVAGRGAVSKRAERPRCSSRAAVAPCQRRPGSAPAPERTRSPRPVARWVVAAASRSG